VSRVVTGGATVVRLEVLDVPLTSFELWESEFHVGDKVASRHDHAWRKGGNGAFEVLEVISGLP
jgi:hypothetical protein